MEQKKAPLDLGLKMLENYKIVRHNEFRFISSEIRKQTGADSHVSEA